MERGSTVQDASGLTHHIDDDRVAEEQGEGEEDPGKIRRLEGDEAEEVHPNHRIPTRPNVDQHDRERLTQKYLPGDSVI